MTETTKSSAVPGVGSTAELDALRDKIRAARKMVNAVANDIGGSRLHDVWVPLARANGELIEALTTLGKEREKVRKSSNASLSGASHD